MSNIINKYNIEKPLSLLFTRSPYTKKKVDNKYNMSGTIPNIRIETDKSSRPTVQIKNPINVGGIDLIKDSDSDSVSSGSTVEPSEPIKKHKTDTKSKSNSKFNADDYQHFINNSKAKPPKSQDSDDSGGNSDDSGSDYSDESGDGSDDSGSDYSDDKTPKKNPKQEKQEILLKLLALEKRGVELTKRYSMSSKLSDLKFELEMHKNNSETEMSVKFQQKILMAAVTGLEFANKKLDPIGAKLDGWSESIMDNLDDYESVFMKLHEKYKHRADLPPELQLLVTLAGSAFMFHVTKSLFSSATSGGMDLQNSEIMKNIASAMAQSKPENNKKSTPMSREISGPSMNLSGMLRDDDSISNSTIETSKEVTINNKGKRALNI